MIKGKAKKLTAFLTAFSIVTASLPQGTGVVAKAAEPAQILELNVPVTVYTDAEGFYSECSFTPENDGYYSFVCSSSLAANGMLSTAAGEDTDYEYIENDDDTGFNIKAELEADVEYILFSYSEAESCTVLVKKANRLRAWAADDPECSQSIDIKVEPQTGTELSVEVEADDYEGITYAWTKDEVLLEEATGSSLETGPIDDVHDYCCEVSDAYGNIVAVFFHVYTGIDTQLDLDMLEEDATVAVHIEGQTPYAEYGFAPAKTGRYVFYSSSSADTYGILYDSDGNELAYDDDSGVGTNFSIEAVLEEGSTYVLKVRFYNYGSGDFNICVSRINSLKAWAKDSEDKASEVYIDVAQGQTANLAVEVLSDDYEGISYSWKRDGVLIPDASLSELEFSADDNYHVYECTVADGYGNSVSVVFRLCIDGIRYFNVNDFGAFGNDEDGDKSGIQKALNKALDYDGMIEVYVPAGNYLLDGILTVYSDTWLHLSDDAVLVRTNLANGMLRTDDRTLKTRGSTGGYEQFSNVIVEGGVWDGAVDGTPETTTDVQRSLMYFCHGEGCVLRNCTVKNACSRHLISFTGMKDVTVENVTVSGQYEFLGQDSKYWAGSSSREGAFRTMEALHFDVIRKGADSGEAQSSWDWPLDNTPCKNVTVKNCNFENLFSAAGGHYSNGSIDEMITQGIIGENFTYTDNVFNNVKYACINDFSRINSVISNNTAENVGEFCRLYHGSGAISENRVSIKKIDDLSINLYGIGVDCGRDVTISGNTIIGPNGQGIYFAESTGTISGNTVTDSPKNGIRISASTVEVSSNVVKNSTSQGISMVDCPDSLVRANEISGSGNSGIYVNGNSGNLGLLDNIIKDSVSHGIALADESYGWLMFNTIENSGSYGMYLRFPLMKDKSFKPSFTYPQDERLTYSKTGNTFAVCGNTVKGSKGTAGIGIIFLEDENGGTKKANKVLVSGNVLNSSELHGIRLTLCDAVVSDNTADGIKGRAINLADCENAEVSTNTINTPVGAGIYLSNSDTAKINGNTVNGGSDHGIAVKDIKKLVLDGNEIKDVTLAGLRLYTSSGEVNGNTVIQCGDNGIYATDCSALTVKGNKVTGPGTSGIYISGEGTHTVSENKVSDAGSNGISLKNGALGTLEYNDVENPAGYGIYLYSETGTLKVLNNYVANPGGTAGIGAFFTATSSSAVRKADITYNTVTGAVKHGISADNLAKSSVSYNSIYKSGGHGIIIKNSSSLKVDHNIAFDNTSRDITVNGSAGTGTKNSVSGTGSAGVRSDNTKFTFADTHVGYVSSMKFASAAYKAYPADVIRPGDNVLTLKGLGETDRFVKWKSSNSKIASVDVFGRITVKKSGTVTITATTLDGRKKASYTLNSFFRDVDNPKKYYYTPVYWAVENGITNGFTNEDGFMVEFGPERSCTRAQMVTFLWRYYGKPEPKSLECSFVDVFPEDYYYKAVLWAAEKGITNGYKEDNTFRPDDVCLREHAVTFMYRAAGKPKIKNSGNVFSDVNKDDYYYKPSLWASENGIAKGYSDGTFGPKKECLREHIVTFMYRLGNPK